MFGPEKIPGHLGEFLGYFMVRKVLAGQELLRASDTMTGKLVRWLAARGYVDAESAADVTERAKDALRDLPSADRLGSLLHDVADGAPEIDIDAIGEADWVEDSLQITDVQPGRIWFEGWHRPDQRPSEGQRSRAPGLVAARDARAYGGNLAAARGRLRPPLRSRGVSVLTGHGVVFRRLPAG